MSLTLSSHLAGRGLLRAANEEQRAGSCSPALETPRIGLALSAGGARGLAHVGVIQVLEENGIPITAIAGTSMGAYVGSVYAAGLDGAALQQLAAEISDRKALTRLLDFAIPPTAGLIRGKKLRSHLQKTLGERTFADLQRPLMVVATDLDSLQPHVFETGPVAAAVHASAAIPGICTPVHLEGRRYTDGGAADPLPVTLLKERFALDAVIAVNVLPTHADLSRCTTEFPPLHQKTGLISRLLRPVNLLADGNVLDTFRRALMCAQVELVEKEAREAEVVIHPFHCGSSWCDFENHARYIETGRRAAERALPAIMALLSNPKTSPIHHETAHRPTNLGCVAA